MDKYLRVAQAFNESQYFISAIGHRGLDKDELSSVLKILNEMDTTKITEALDSLYKYHPRTIELNKSWSKSNCNRFSENCDCFLPDVAYEDCYCQQLRREIIYTHDRRNYKEYSEWRLSVFRRDSFSCQDCGQIGGELNAHHIKGYKKYSKLRITLGNGVTLCKQCHKKRHRKRKGEEAG